MQTGIWEGFGGRKDMEKCCNYDLKIENLKKIHMRLGERNNANTFVTGYLDSYKAVSSEETATQTISQ